MAGPESEQEGTGFGAERAPSSEEQRQPGSWDRVIRLGAGLLLGVMEML